MEDSKVVSYYEAAFDDDPKLEIAESRGYADDDAVMEEPIDEDTYTLLYRGELLETVNVAGRLITLKTLKIGEELEASLIANRYKDSVDSGRALAAALVAASIVSVDGEPLIGELGPTPVSLEAKFKYVLENWYWVTVAKLYVAYDGLLNRSLQALDEIKKD
jgi:hypothetical protein